MLSLSKCPAPTPKSARIKRDDLVRTKAMDESPAIGAKPVRGLRRTASTLLPGAPGRTSWCTRC